MARKPRNYAAEYAARKARGAAAGKSLNESIGKSKRDHQREYRERIIREVAAGKRPPPKARPRNNQAPTGQKLSGAKRWDGPESCEPAERYVMRLRGDRRVFLYALVEIWNGTKHRSENLQLFPNGGIRAQTLRKLIRQSGSLEQLFLDEIGGGDRIRTDENPAVNPSNRRGKSGKLISDSSSNPDDDEFDESEIEFVYVVVQWTS